MQTICWSYCSLCRIYSAVINDADNICGFCRAVGVRGNIKVTWVHQESEHNKWDWLLALTLHLGNQRASIGPKETSCLWRTCEDQGEMCPCNLNQFLLRAGYSVNELLWIVSAVGVGALIYGNTQWESCYAKRCHENICGIYCIDVSLLNDNQVLLAFFKDPKGSHTYTQLKMQRKSKLSRKIDGSWYKCNKLYAH